ncbi:MAG TPA: FAD/NAD(P)-binding protein [Allosphingosinicella sp.]|nr:FAD/NAD(P)-binding protein [Allosphingosinicella sp.]
MRHVAIVGGGFSGAMLAVHLLRSGARVTLFERHRQPGRGLAYGAADPIHLLNVRAGNMSAYPDEPGHFAAWLEARGIANAAAQFAPRLLFGTYIEEQFAAAVAAAPDHFTHLLESVEDLETSPTGATLVTATGERIEADAAVLALGNLPPPAPPGIDPAALPTGTYWGDPWAPGATDGLGEADAVLLIGTGLTMVDLALLLEERGFAGRIVALSRRGLVPLAHCDEPPAPDKRIHAPAALDSRLVREVRTRASRIAWRHAVDELRPFSQSLWHTATTAERRRFIRHLRPWWDVHRHRIAPQVAERIHALIGAGRLQTVAGKLAGSEAREGGVTVRWRPRGAADVEEARFTRIINCTGPEGDLPRSPEPLLRNLLTRGAVRPGPIGLGVDADDDARVRAADGTLNPRLYAVGPLTRGLWWEIVAVPDIRVQVAEVAAALASPEEQA